MLFKYLLTICLFHQMLVDHSADGAAFVERGINDIESNEREPNFVTPGQTYRIATDATVVLPCRVSEPGGYVLAWKRGAAVLTAGPVKVTPDPRIRLLSSPPGTNSVPGVPGLSGGGYNLEIRSVQTKDAGDYICQIGTLIPREIAHTLEILVPPRIHLVSHASPIEVLQGSSVKLECKASGNPVPIISWTRKNNVMPSGERSLTGQLLYIQHVDRHSAGLYQCSADNGVGQPDTKSITLTVLYPPEIEVERPIVHTGLGLEAQLVCVVYAEPSPHIVWYKDTAQIGTTEQYVLQSRGNKHILVLRNVTYVDFGNYSCSASNNQGKSRGHITLTGTADDPVFESLPLGFTKHSYNISWMINSHSHILEYRLFYRVQPDQYRTYNPHGFESKVYQKMQHNNESNSNYQNEWNRVVLSENFSDVYHNNNNNNNNNHHYQRQSQHNYNSNVLQSSQMTQLQTAATKYHRSYLIKGLYPATHYEARIQARNLHGWNRMSHIFSFTTRSSDPDILMEPSAQPAVYGETYDRETDGSRATGKQQTIFHSFILGTITITITITLLVLF